MKKVRLLFFVCLTLVASLVFAAGAFAAAPKKVSTAWLDEHETFLMWYGVQKGWDKEEGLDIEMHLFESGVAALNALPAGQWVLGAYGGVPGTIGYARYDTYVIGNGNDESLTNAVMVRPNSPILKTKGFNPQYPEVYGHPNDVRGKEILVTTATSAHYAMSNWLRVLGLTDADVKITNIDQAQAVAAFTTGVGDVAVLWAPHMFVGEEKGWKIAATPHTCKVGLPIVLVADKKFADANPETVAKFLRIYLRAVNMLQKEPPASLVPEYQRFFLEFVGMKYSAETALKDLQTHPVFNLEQQLAMFDASKGRSIAQTWQAEIAEFFTKVGRLTQDDLKKAGSGAYATDKFLKLVKTPIPPYK
jgi:NitT/TauT family transport system substrate-binding protein/sulfonate transport system substrate-binding protein